MHHVQRHHPPLAHPRPLPPRPGPVLRTGSATALGWSPDGRHLTELTASALHVRDREAGLPAAGQDKAGARDLAVWRLTDGDGDTELVYHVPRLTEGIGGFRVSRFSRRGDTLVLSTGTELLEGLGAGILLLATDPARLVDTLCSVRIGPVPARVWCKTFPDLAYAAPCA